MEWDSIHPAYHLPSDDSASKHKDALPQDNSLTTRDISIILLPPFTGTPAAHAGRIRNTSAPIGYGNLRAKPTYISDLPSLDYAGNKVCICQHTLLPDDDNLFAEESAYNSFYWIPCTGPDTRGCPNHCTHPWSNGWYHAHCTNLQGHNFPPYHNWNCEHCKAFHGTYLKTCLYAEQRPNKIDFSKRLQHMIQRGNNPPLQKPSSSTYYAVTSPTTTLTQGIPQPISTRTTPRTPRGITS